MAKTTRRKPTKAKTTRRKATKAKPKATKAKAAPPAPPPAPPPDAQEPTLAEAVLELARLQFEPEEVALILEIDVARLAEPDLARAYKVGTLKGEAEIRRSIMTMAKQGSSPAQKQYTDLIVARKRSERTKEREASGKIRSRGRQR